MPITDILKTGRIPYNYKVGEKSSGKPLPFDVKLSVDPDFKKTILKAVGMLALGVGGGIAVGIVIAKAKNSRSK